MPRGRHRHSPPLHRLLPPSAIAGVSLVCAVGPWLFTEPMVLRGLAAGAALTAVLGAVVLRRWDSSAGKQVADLTRARASDEWRHEERVAELETDLDESRELRVKLEHKLRAKRSELAGLRNEHAALLRRYATAETERATALEGRRLLEIETTEPARALPAALTASTSATDTPTDTPTDTAADSDSDSKLAAADAEVSESPESLDTSAATEAAETGSAAGPDDSADADADDKAEEPKTAEAAEAAEGEDGPDAPDAPEVFSPTGSSLFLRANAALNRIANGAPGTDDDPEPDAALPGEPEHGGSQETGAETAAKASASESAAPEEGEAAGKPGAVGGHERAAAEAKPFPPEPAPKKPSPSRRSAAKSASSRRSPAKPSPAEPTQSPSPASVPAPSPTPAPSAENVEPADHPEPPTPPDRPASAKPAKPVKPVKPAPSAGHFTVPTAVAVVPAAPVRRPSVEGGFDFFGTQAEQAEQAEQAQQAERAEQAERTRQPESPNALDAVQNEDLADVVGQEALALHKAEAESGFKPADEESRGVGQVIDLTVHDETERIDVAELRSAVS
ncbi:hypothetical protein ACFVGN_09815 [Streptomyces sp. NPDC057757]|uniref:hypothetical protein n=1 Tax=Streptomyces sp. NPDC057757 TaxID=3346241 RepID=UPI0036AB21B9